MMDKQQIRHEIRQRKRQYSEQELRVLSLAIIDRLQEEQHIKAAQTILLYHSLPDEVYTHEWIDHLAHQGKTILLPEVTDQAHMRLRRYTGRHDLKEGAFGIMEPCGEVFPEEAYPEIDVAIIPGMSFDSESNRLGRGKGYYDRFLALLPDVYKIGVCFDFQKTAHVPTTPTDIRMDKVC